MTTPGALGKSLELRKRIKAKKPRFIRQDAFRFPKLKNKDHWRRPQGRHSKIRAKKKGQATLVRWGYGSPRDVRGLFTDGQLPVHVFRVEDIERLDSKKHIAVIGGSVGTKKRLELAAMAQKKGINVFNIGNLSSYQEMARKDMEEKRKLRRTILARREKKQEKKPAAQKREEKEKVVEKETAKEEVADQGTEAKLQQRLESEKVIIHK